MMDDDYAAEMAAAAQAEADAMIAAEGAGAEAEYMQQLEAEHYQQIETEALEVSHEEAKAAVLKSLHVLAAAEFQVLHNEGWSTLEGDVYVAQRVADMKDALSRARVIL